MGFALLGEAGLLLLSSASKEAGGGFIWSPTTGTGSNKELHKQASPGFNLVESRIVLKLKSSGC